MIRKLSHIILILMSLLISGCIKETYDMNKLSSKVHLSPTFAVSAVRGGFKLSDLVESGDTLVIDKNNLIKIVLRQDSIFDLTIWDFFNAKSDIKFNNGKGFGQLIAKFDPDSINLEIEEILNGIEGDFNVTNPSMKLYYSNSFSFPVKMKLDVEGKRKDYTPVNLDLDTFALSYTNDPDMPDILDSLSINKSNSSIADIFSLPPEEITLSGSVMMDTLGTKDSYLSSQGRILGNLEIEVPLELSMNLEFTDTLDNFFADAFEDGSEFSWDDIESLSVDVKVDNGFPLGVSLTMDLFDSSANPPEVISSIPAEDLLIAAPVNSDGRVAQGVTVSSSASITLTKEFFSSIELADKVILRFKLNTTGNDVVKIYSDYALDFSAAFMVKPDITTYLK